MTTCGPNVSARTVTADDHLNPVLVIHAVAWRCDPLLDMDAAEFYPQLVLASTIPPPRRNTPTLFNELLRSRVANGACEIHTFLDEHQWDSDHRRVSVTLEVP